MHPPLSFLVWAQTQMPGVPDWFAPSLQWLYVWGDPGISVAGIRGGLITWLKVVGLFALLAWVFSWVAAALRTRDRARTDWLDVAALVALVGCLGSVVLNVLQSTGRIQSLNARGYSVSSTIALAFGLVILLWVERSLWTSIRRLGRASDAVVLAGIHLAIVAGIGVAYLLLGARTGVPGSGVAGSVPINLVLISGVRLGATYMGLVVLARVAWLLAPELLAIRPRRLVAIARHSVTESTRRMWAPWVVIVLFAVILAFTHWFLPAPLQRPAELGRIYVGTLTLLCMLLLTVMVTVLAPLGMPQDIQAQTIYTVVTKPVRRLEMVWGRMVGYMAIVTGLVLVFGLVSLLYLFRNVGGTITLIEKQALAVQQTDPERARFLTDQAEQLRSRMSARVPVNGSLTFIDSRGTPKIRGIDVGQELEFRSHIEGGTPAAAIWRYGVVPDPIDPRLPLDRRIPVASLLKPDTIEAIENDAMVLQYGVDALERRQKDPASKPADAAQAATEATRAAAQVRALRDRSRKLQDRFEDLTAQARKAAAEKKPEESDRLRREAAALHSPPVPLEMTFTIYRTTKGRVGDPVYAEIEVENPRVRDMAKYRDTFPIREYYINKRFLPASYLVGSLGSLNVTIHCMSPTQYLGMAESDFFLLAESGNFGQNFMKGLFGIWLQAMVLTAIGVFAGTFLSWPVALLFTIAFFIAGHAAFSILKDFYLQTLVGGGPFESLIRLLSHDNQVSDLAPTLGVVVAKTLDSVVMPVMSTMVYLIPNLGTLDVSNTVAEGFAVGWPLILQNTLVALGYVVPFTIGGYFILKNREVAA
jgi:ABC-type transport system involved in multi-copper enzyme maturation permease subunit